MASKGTSIILLLLCLSYAFGKGNYHKMLVLTIIAIV